MFYHAYDGYMTHAFPHDDLKPISCTGVRSELLVRGSVPWTTWVRHNDRWRERESLVSRVV
jgi:transposase